MSYIGKKPSFSQVRTAELVVQRGTDITTAGTVAALDVSNISLVRLTAATVLQGLVAPVSPATNGKRVTLVNANSVSLTVSNESGSATAANRISTGISRDLVITAGASVTLFYNTASSRWSVESSSSEINIDRLQVATEAIVLNSVDLAPTSSPKSGLIELTAGSQTSFRSISTGANGQFLAIINKTGSLLQIANEEPGATAGNRIVTGTGGPISLQNNASLFLAYLGSASRWQVVGGTGSGGGATEQVTQTGIGSLAVGTPLYVDAVSGWVAANASASNTAEVAGMVGRSLSANLAEIVMAGEVSGVAAAMFTENALPARGEVVFLSTTSGKLTITEPSVIGRVSKPLGIVHNVGGSSVDIMFFNMRGAVVGGANARTTISLSNNAVTTVQNALAYDAGELTGWVYIDATTDLRFYVQAQFAKNGAGTNYNLSFQTTGDTPPAGFTVGITAGGLIQVTLPSLAGFSSASINFALNAPAVGTAFPLQVDADKVNNPGSTPIYSAGQWSFKNSTAVTSVTITDAGNVGVGTASPGNYGTANTKQITVLSGDQNITLGAYWQSGVGQYGIINAGTTNNGGATALVFQTGGSERVRIDASGNLLVGKTAQSSSTVGVEARPGGGFSAASSAATNGSSTLEVYSTGAGAFRFYVGLGGTVFATSTTITGISDERLKENIRDLDDGLNVVLALKPRKFDWKEGKGADIKNARGFIAQEFEQVLPDMVEEWKDPAPEGEEPYRAVNANLIPTLVKAIQEQQAQIEALKAEVAALKAP